MSSIFSPSKPKAPDTSHIEKQQREADERAAAEREKRDARMRASRAGRGAGRSLLLGGSAAGVSDDKKSTLGG